jgi:hypothetical protein
MLKLQTKTTQLSWIKVYHKVWSIKGHKGSHGSNKLHQNHVQPFHSQLHILYSREDPRPLITASSTIMIFVHFAKVSARYPCILISSLVAWVENLLFCHSLHFLWCMAQRTLHVITNVYYRSMSCFATVSPSKAPLAVLKFPQQRPLSHHVGMGKISSHFPLIWARHATYSIPNY